MKETNPGPEPYEQCQTCDRRLQFKKYCETAGSHGDFTGRVWWRPEHHDCVRTLADRMRVLENAVRD